MKIKRYRYEALLANEERLAVMQDILDSDLVSRSYPDIEYIISVLGLNGDKYKRRMEALEEEDRKRLAEYRMRQEGGKGNGDTV